MLLAGAAEVEEDDVEFDDDIAALTVQPSITCAYACAPVTEAVKSTVPVALRLL